MTHRRCLAVVVIALAGLAGACGGGGGGDTNAPPGANVDPNATGYVGGPVNGAKTQASNLEQQQQQVVEQSGG